MMRIAPSAAAYARVSYAREISGDLDGALRLMQMALDATSAHDPESQAWHHAQVGDLHLFEQARLADGGAGDTITRRSSFPIIRWP